MFQYWRNRSYSIAAALVASVVLASSIGCVGVIANLMHVANGNFIPAEFTGLEAKRVAVVCVSNSESFGPTEASVILARRVGSLLEQSVDEIQLIDEQQVGDWIDRNDWDYLDYAAVGRGVDAEIVVAIDLNSFSLHEGKTLYKGRADVSLVVYDMTQDAKRVFSTKPPQIQYPLNSGYHTTDISEEEFRRQFLGLVARRIARNFYRYDVKEDYAQDATLVGAR